MPRFKTRYFYTTAGEPRISEIKAEGFPWPGGIDDQGKR